jgi:hypothetical protein
MKLQLFSVIILCSIKGLCFNAAYCYFIVQLLTLEPFLYCPHYGDIWSPSYIALITVIFEIV